MRFIAFPSTGFRGYSNLINLGVLMGGSIVSLPEAIPISIWAVTVSEVSLLYYMGYMIGVMNRRGWV